MSEIGAERRSCGKTFGKHGGFIGHLGTIFNINYNLVDLNASSRALAKGKCPAQEMPRARNHADRLWAGGWRYVTDTQVPH